MAGSVGSLYIDPEHTVTVSDGPDFPVMLPPLAKAIEELQQRISVVRK